MSVNIVEYNDIRNQNFTETLLTTSSQFTTGESTKDNGMDGHYIVVDTRRNVFIRSGAASVGTNKRWLEHIKSSFLKKTTDQLSALYLFYPYNDASI